MTEIISFALHLPVAQAKHLGLFLVSLLFPSLSPIYQRIVILEALKFHY